MPRGNDKNNRTKSPISGDYGLMATPDELSALTANMKENFIRSLNRPPVDLHSVESMTSAIIEYFNDCQASGKRPGNMGLYRALGLTRQDVNNVLTGKSKSKVSPDCIDILKKSINLLGEYREQLGALGKLNPVTLIFWQKNYDGLQDNTVLTVSADRGPAANLSPDEIQKQLEKDIPIDIDSMETD